MAFPELHFFAANDVNGDPILEVPVTEDYVERLVARPALSELGSLAFQFSRQVGFRIFDSGAFQPETFVRLLVPSIHSTRYLWGCFLDDRVQQVVARIKAGENYMIGGPGPKFYLTRAILWDEQFTGAGYLIDLENGVFRWKETAKAGKILLRLLAEDAANTITEFLPDLTYSFDETDDSDGNPWVNDIAGSDEFELRIGDDYLTNLFKLEETGDLETTMHLGFVGAPLLRLDAHQDYGRDLSGAIGASTVHFKEGVNILGDLTVTGASRRKASHALVEGMDGIYARSVRASWDPGEYAKAIMLSRSEVKNENVLERYGNFWLRRQAAGENEVLIPHYPGFSQSNGLYFPGPTGSNGHYWLGDTISLTTGSDDQWTPLDYRSEDQRVMAITMEMRSVVKDGSQNERALSWNVVAELNVERDSDTVPEARGEGGNGGVGCKCLRLCATGEGIGLELVTSTSWKVTPTSSVPAGWHLAGFDDSAYANAVVTDHGIWSNTGIRPSAEERALRKEFTLTELPSNATLAVSADNGAEVYINGVLQVTHGAEARGGSDINPQNWSFESSVSVDTGDLVIGDNCISIIGWNETDPNPQGAGVYARLTLTGGIDLTGTDPRAARCDHNHLHNDLLERDAAEAHPASSVTYDPTGTPLASTDAQGAITELSLDISSGGTGGATHRDISAMHRYPLWAHRGDIGSADSKPEQTIEALRQAILKGCEGVECDFWPSSDGTFWSMHDDTVNRTTTSTGTVASKNDAAMAALVIDAGFGYISGSFSVPTLAQVIDALRPYDAVLKAQIKFTAQADIERFAQEIIDNDYVSRTIIEVNTHTLAGYVKGVSPSLTTMINGATSGNTDADWGSYEASGITNLAYSTSRAPKRIGAYVSISDYGSDESTWFQDAFDRGASSFQTNNVDAALALRQALIYGSGAEPTADAHIADTTDAHDASAVSVLDTGGNFTGTNVETVLAELFDAIGSAELGGHYEVVVSGTAPPVAVTNPAEDDWVYGWVSD